MFQLEELLIFVNTFETEQRNTEIIQAQQATTPIRSSNAPRLQSSNIEVPIERSAIKISAVEPER